MNAQTFVTLLFSFSIITSLIVEVIKKLFKDIHCLNIIATVVGIVVGGVGSIIYFVLNNIAFTTNNVIFIVLFGLSSGVTAMIGFDKVKEALQQIGFLDSSNKL